MNNTCGFSRTHNKWPWHHLALKYNIKALFVCRWVHTLYLIYNKFLSMIYVSKNVHTYGWSFEMHYIQQQDTYMYVVSGSRQRMINGMEERGSGMSPSITHGDLAPDMISSTKLNMVSGKRKHHHKYKDTYGCMLLFLSTKHLRHPVCLFVCLMSICNQVWLMICN